MRKNILDIKSQKSGDKIVVLTAYTAPMARILDQYCDILLVGDSLGMLVYGMDSTLPVSLNMMINHGSAVVKSSEKALVVVDMPFGSYQESAQQAFRNAAKIIARTGCQAVKLEGGEEIIETVEFLVKRGIPVMGHIGLKPQSVNQMGGYKVQGKDKTSAKQILDDAKALEEAGCFSIVIEGVEKKLADKITSSIKIPTIGIGASAECDGQVLVSEDMLGLNENVPKFVKRYANLDRVINTATESYSHDVKAKKFPSEDNCY